MSVLKRRLAALTSIAMLTAVSAAIVAPTASASCGGLEATLLKTDPAGAPLAGAEFTVTADDASYYLTTDRSKMIAGFQALNGGQTWDQAMLGLGVGKSVSVTTDAAGKAVIYSSGGLEKCMAGLTFTETKAPTGYDLAAPASIPAFPTRPSASTASITIVDQPTKPTPTPTVTPTPTPTVTPTPAPVVKPAPVVAPKPVVVKKVVQSG